MPSAVFEKQGGIEIALADRSDVDMAIAHEGITIDHGCTHDVPKLYATQKGYDYLIAEQIPFTYIPREPVNITMKGPEEIFKNYKSLCMPVMDFYPTYEGYIEMMYNFQDQYPDLCKVFSIGTLNSGRELMMIQIGDDIETNDDEPNFLYTSTMHGDETAGFPLMLQFIDYLLCNYDSDTSISALVDNINIYINPLANPDGTYTNDNSTVENATRRNANFIDLNRNFPDPKDGQNPDNRPTQDETQAFIDFADAYNIQLSCNFHGGAEVVNYPWDTWEKRHADDSWWIEKCRDYATSCQDNSRAGYMTDLDNGVTNGYDWYEVVGGRQDLMNYFKRGREMTLELSSRKLVNSDQLPELWEANRDALIQYMEEALYGLRGIVRDCETGMPLRAEILIPDHDIDNSSVFSDSTLGNYFRYLDDGDYMVSYIAEGYDTLMMPVTIFDKTSTVTNVELCKQMTSTQDRLQEDISIWVANGVLYLQHDEQEYVNTVEVLSIDGKTLKKSKGNNSDVSFLQSGIYLARISIGEEEVVLPFYKN